MAYPFLRRPVSAARVVCGNQPVALINASSDAPSSLESISITSACLEPGRGPPLVERSSDCAEALAGGLFEMALARAAFGGEGSDAFMPSPTPIASRPARVITRLTFFLLSSRQIGIPAFE